MRYINTEVNTERCVDSVDTRIMNANQAGLGEAIL